MCRFSNCLSYLQLERMSQRIFVFQVEYLKYVVHVVGQLIALYHVTSVTSVMKGGEISRFEPIHIVTFSQLRYQHHRSSLHLL